MGEWRRGGVGKWGVAKGGGKKNGRAKKTGVARDLCHPHKYTSVYVYDRERGRRKRDRRREGVI